MNIQVHILIFKSSKLKIGPKETLIKENSGRTKSMGKERSNGQTTRSIQRMEYMYSDHSTASVLLSEYSSFANEYFNQISIL